MVQHPNKTFVAEFITDTCLGNLSKHVIIVAAKNEETATAHLYNIFKIRPKLTWLMGCDNPTFYDQKGKELEIQAKILYRTNTIISK